MVSTTAWQSTPAVKPGPTLTTTGASVICVPKFFLARMASTSPSGCSAGRHVSCGSGSTGTMPSASRASACSAVSARTAQTPSTTVSPWVMAGEKHTVRRMAVGWGRSVMTTCIPLRYSRRATPVAMSPAPRIKISIVVHPFVVLTVAQRKMVVNMGQV